VPSGGGACALPARGGGDRGRGDVRHHPGRRRVRGLPDAAHPAEERQHLPKERLVPAGRPPEEGRAVPSSRSRRRGTAPGPRSQLAAFVTRSPPRRARPPVENPGERGTRRCMRPRRSPRGEKPPASSSQAIAFDYTAAAAPPDDARRCPRGGARPWVRFSRRRCAEKPGVPVEELLHELGRDGTAARPDSGTGRRSRSYVRSENPLLPEAPGPCLLSRTIRRERSGQSAAR